MDISGIKVPRYIRIEDICIGDIGNDGIEDMAIIYGLHVKLTGDEEYDAEGKRIVCLYRQNEDGTYEYWQENRTMIRNAWNEVNFNNTDFGLNIIDGEFYCTVDGYQYCFAFRDAKLVMTRSVWDKLHGGYDDILDGRWPCRYWNYEEGVTEEYAEGFGDTESLKISEESFEPVLISFEDVGKEGVVYPSLEFQGYLPVLYKLETYQRIQLHASEWSMRPVNTGAKLLDYIKETYYPDMVCVEMGYSDEVIANNVELLGYVFPTYYYLDEQGNRLYFCDTYPESYWNHVQQDCLVHVVMYEDIYGNKIKYMVEDSSMEVVTKP